MFPPACQKTVALYHLPTTGGSTQSYPASADVTVTATVLPMDRKQAALSDVDLLDPWELYVEAGTDVRLNDKAIIAGDSTNYYVVHIFRAAFGGLAHLRVTISKAQ